MTTEVFTSGGDNKEAALHLQKTDYLASVCTNEVTLRRVVSKEMGYEIFNGLRNIGLIYSDAKGEAICEIFPLQKSPCSNHIGISTLAITKTGKIRLTKQSEKSAIYPRALAPSGSGSANWSDLRNTGGNFTRFLQKAMERELIEELGLKHLRKPKIQTKVIGFARILNRGGKPEFFGVSFLDVPEEQGKVSNKERVFTEGFEEIIIPAAKELWDTLSADRSQIGAESKQEICQAIDDFIATNQYRLSPSLYLNLRFFKEWIESIGKERG